MDSAATSIIDVHTLHRSFGSREAVAGISSCVRRGEILGLLGPNGAGKSTTIRMLTGKIDSSRGSATMAGYDVVTERTALKHALALSFKSRACMSAFPPG